MKFPLFSIALFLSVFASALAAPPAERLRLESGHAELSIVIEPDGTNLFRLVMADEEAGLERSPAHVVLVVPEAARLTVPEGLEELGSPGDPIWVLPQSQNEALLYLGVSGEELPAGVITGNPDLILRRVEGPADLVLWQFDQGSGLQVRLSTRDGLSEADKVSPLVGGHEHFNWGFSTNGLTTLWFQVRATVGGTNAWSAETPLLFAVEPLPEEPGVPAVLIALTVTPDNWLLVAFSGTPGIGYAVEYSLDLKTWELFEQVTAKPEPSLLPIPIPVNAPAVFVRAVRP